MTLHTLRLADIPPTPWRNGGGRTRELLCWPGIEWQVRISVAEIAADGAFSAFPGVERWFAVIEGDGVTLALPGGDAAVGAVPLRFDGGSGPYCRLSNGPTRDLNLMLRHAHGSMRIVAGAWRERIAMRALFASSSGRWGNGGAHVDVEPGTLLWSDDDDATEWHFDSAGAAWWMGASGLASA